MRNVISENSPIDNVNIRIGDIVRFLTDKLEGKVTGILDHSTVNVYVEEYGFEIPASVHDLVVIHTDVAPSAEGGAVAGQPLKQVDMLSADTLFLAVVPDNFNQLTASRFELFVVNDTAQTCLYTVAFRRGERYTGVVAGNCPPDAAASVGSYSLKDIDADIKAIRIQALFFQKGSTQPKPPVDEEVRIGAATLCKAGAYRHARWFNGISLLRPLGKEQTVDLEEMDVKQLAEAIREKKAADVPANRPAKAPVGNVLEVDLHSHEILETTAGMDNRDILEYQLEVFRRTMEECKLRRGQRIVFIHGKGDGVLRQRILWELQSKYKRHHHQDASFKQYGYGATLVTIK